MVDPERLEFQQRGNPYCHDHAVRPHFQYQQLKNAHAFGDHAVCGRHYRGQTAISVSNAGPGWNLVVKLAVFDSLFCETDRHRRHWPIHRQTSWTSGCCWWRRFLELCKCHERRRFSSDFVFRSEAQRNTLSRTPLAFLKASTWCFRRILTHLLNTFFQFLACMIADSSVRHAEFGVDAVHLMAERLVRRVAKA